MDLARWTDGGSLEVTAAIFEARLRGMEVQRARVLSVALHGNGEHWVKLRMGDGRAQLRFYKRKPGWAFVGRTIVRVRPAGGFVGGLPKHLAGVWP